MKKLQPRAVIFDLGSTLIEYEATPWSELNIICAESARQFLTRRGFTLPKEQEFYQLFEKAKVKHRELAAQDWIEWTVPQVISEILDALGIEYEEGLIDQIFAAYYKPVNDNLFVYDDTLETLEKIRDKIQTIGLISNTIFPEEAHLGELNQFGINQYLDFRIFSSTFRVRKPHPQIFRKAAELAGCEPSECVYIGDRYLEDIEGPASIGMPAILKMVPKREYPPDMELATRRISCLAELSDHLEI